MLHNKKRYSSINRIQQKTSLLRMKTRQRRTQQRQLSEYEEHIDNLQAQIQHTTHLYHELENKNHRYNKLILPKIFKPLFKIEIAISSANRYRKAFQMLVKEKGSVGKAYQFLRRHCKQHGLRSTKNILKAALSGKSHSITYNYNYWVDLYDKCDIQDIIRMKEIMQKWQQQPVFSVLMPVYNPPIEMLDEAIWSIRNQIYPNWEFCIADDASTNPKVREILSKHQAEDSRIKVVYREKNGHISAASNSALEIATGEFVVLFDNDDILPNHALYWVAKTVNQYPNADLIYSDEDKIDEQGRRSNPYFKPDWNEDLFYSHNMISHLGVYRTQIMKELGGFKLGLEGSQDYDLALRFIETIPHENIIHIPKVLYHWRVHAASTASSSDAKPYAVIAGEKALNQHFERMNYQGKVEFIKHSYYAKYNLPNELPKVSIIIPTRDGYNLIRTCIESIVHNTDYENYEILIIDNGSKEFQTLSYFKQLEKVLDNIRIIQDDSPFNYSALNNKAVQLAQGSILCFMNNDIEVISSNWLSEMVSHALRPKIGAVGAKLLYPNNTIQHTGVILGIGGVAAHSHVGFAADDDGYFGYNSIIRNYSAVTAACLVVQKSIFESAGGFNEKDLTVAFNDVDLCLKIKKLGFRNVFTPNALLYHHESATRGKDISEEKRKRFQGEQNYMLMQWKYILENDPAYNPNLGLHSEHFELAFPPRISKF